MAALTPTDGTTGGEVASTPVAGAGTGATAAVGASSAAGAAPRPVRLHDPAPAASHS